MKRLLLFAAMIFSLAVNGQLRFTSVDVANQVVTIKNFGGTTVDMSMYQFCTLFEYDALNSSSVVILSGDLVLSSQEEVTLEYNATSGFNSSTADLCLYSNPVFTNASFMQAFFEYGAGMQGRENVAVTAGLWTANTFLTGGTMYYYTGNGTESGANFYSTELPGGPNVVINEIDCDQVGTDAAEFVELFGEPNTSLDGLVLVFFNGSSDLSYTSFDLTGYSLDANGFFVAGNTGVTGVSLVFDGNLLQNGADAVALYQASINAWPASTPLSTVGLIDAVVYGTADPADTGLLDVLTPGQSQVDESATGNSTANAIARVPNGGTPFDLSTYVTQQPTPNASNILSVECSGGSIADTFGAFSLEICSDQDNAPIEFVVSSTAPGDGFLYVVTDLSNNILLTSTSSIIDIDGLGSGNKRVYAVSYTGALDPVSYEVGLPLSGIIGDACVSISSNSVFLSETTCTPPPCDGGTVTIDTYGSTAIVCNDDLADALSFTTVSAVTESNFTLFLTDASDNIIQEIISPYDFETLENGVYHIWSVAYLGSFDPNTTTIGLPIGGLLTDGACLDISDSPATVEIISCQLGEGCVELFISEYLEGSAFNKAIEIFNPTNFTVDLTEYTLFGYNNGSIDFTSVLALQGTLDAGETIVITNSQASAELQALADTLNNLTLFNGNDAIELRHNDIVIDVIGIIGQDPGAVGWNVSTGSTVNNVLVRKPEVNAPTTNWTLSSSQWLVYDQDDLTHIGNHSFYSCSEIPQIGFELTAIGVQENIGIYAVEVNGYNLPVEAIVTVNATSGSAEVGVDTDNIFPVTLNFPMGSSTQIINLPIIDDVLQEGAEFFTLTLESEQEIDFINPQFVISILHSDQSYPYYPIAEVSTTDANGYLDSLDIFCELRGIVHGINFNSAGTHFTLIDATDGVKVFHPTNNFGYSVTEGDSVRVYGQLMQFMGQAEFRPDSIIYVDGGHPLEFPMVVNTLSESNESHLVTVECVSITYDTDWTNAGSSFIVRVWNGTNEIEMIIQEETDIYTLPILNGHFTVTGIVEQADPSDPYTENYIIWPRYINDISNQVIASFTTEDPIIYGDAGEEVSFVNDSEGAVGYNWTFGDNSTSTDENPTHTYSFDYLANADDITIFLLATNEFGCTDTSGITVFASYVGIEDITAQWITIYPNPVLEEIQFTGDVAIQNITVFAINGQIIDRYEGINSTLFRINASEWSSGSYLLQVTTERGLEIHQIIKE